MDLVEDPALRDKVNPFVKLLWERGTLYEKEVIEGLEETYVDLSPYAADEREQKTLEAMENGEALIYQGRIRSDDLLGGPDLLRLVGHGYVAGDIKSGSGLEGDPEDGKPKKHYAVQIALYTDLLERIGKSAGRSPFIWDVHGNQVTYDLDEPQGVRNPQTFWSLYQETLTEARGIVAGTHPTRAAYAASCKMCHWYTACLDRLTADDDLTLIPQLGRAKRDVMIDTIGSISELAETNVDVYFTGKKTQFKGIGPDTLEKFQERAALLKSPNSAPYLRAPIALPISDLELFFDIEVDPMRDICYLHGFVERQNGDNSTEKFVPFFAEEATADAEKAAFELAWTYIQENDNAIIYYYSKYERTWWRNLQRRYPDVCSEDDIENLFDPAKSVDLYFDVVLKATEWPTRDFSIKTLASYLGFDWRDEHPSGAASIEWFDRWITTGDKSIMQRILDYNEDDCIATRVLLDGIRDL